MCRSMRSSSGPDNGASYMDKYGERREGEPGVLDEAL
jgi:hypothetical protein